MAEKDKKVYSRELIGTTEWGKEKKNNKRLNISIDKQILFLYTSISLA